MNKLEQNALRIAELMGYKATKDNKYFTHTKKQYQRAIDYNELINSFSFYSGLMPIVFECNNNTNMEIHIYPPTVQLLGYKKYVFGYKNNLDKTEPEFIEAIQECVIKYLELKNG